MAARTKTLTTEQRVARMEQQMDRIEKLTEQLCDEPGDVDTPWTLEQRVQWIERRLTGTLRVDAIQTERIEVVDNTGRVRVTAGRVDPGADPSWGLKVDGAAEDMPYAQMSTSDDCGDAVMYLSNGANIAMIATTFPPGEASDEPDASLVVCRDGRDYWQAASSPELSSIATALRGSAYIMLALTKNIDGLSAFGG